MRGKITKSAVDALQVGELLADTEVKGFVARRLPSGVVTYGLRYRAGGKQRWLALGLHGQLTPDRARRLAKQRAGEVAGDRDPHAELEANREKAASAATVDAVLDSFLKRHVHKNLRSAGEVERVFTKYVRPRIGPKSILDLRRRDVVAMLDAVEDENGPVMADRTLAHVRKAFHWWAARDDSFVPPIVRGMARTKPAERARKRILADDEIRDIWSALDQIKAPAAFPRLVRTLLLTAQRRDEVARMRWEEIDLRAKAWTVPGERRKNGEPNAVPLTDMVAQLLGKPRKKGFVFSTTDGEKPFSGFSKSKGKLDLAVNAARKKARREPVVPWVLHDLRRTARSLLSRCGVDADIGERVLGHAIPGVRGVYDRHSFFDEKKNALDRLSRTLEEVLKPRSDRVE